MRKVIVLLATIPSAMATNNTDASVDKATNQFIDYFSELAADKDFAQAAYEEALSNLNITVEPDYEMQNIFKSMVSSGEIYVGKDGRIYVEAKTQFDRLEELKKDMDFLNLLIDNGLYKVNSKFEASIDVKEYAKNASAKVKNEINEYVSEHVCSHESCSLMAAHTCSYTKVNLASICATNYSTIYNYFLYCVELQTRYGDAIDPFAMTVAEWVAYVRPNAPWDYKATSTYGNNKTLCLTYSGATNSHQAMGGEFMGNYNYGYTGKILFSLTVLKTASWVLAYGYGDGANEHEDQVVITMGYNAAP